MRICFHPLSSCLTIRCLKKDLLKLSLLSNKIHLAGDLPSPHCLWRDLSKMQISLCLFLAKNHLKGPFPPTTGIYYNILSFFSSKFFSTNTENSFTESHACTVYSSKNGLPILLNGGISLEKIEAAIYTLKLIPIHF